METPSRMISSSAMLRGLARTVERGGLRLVSSKNQYPPLFIVGAPRCGTTVVSLHLTNTFGFSYFPNISKRNPDFPVVAAALGSLIWEYTPTAESSYGIVDGPMAPSDGWHIFHRWFPRYDHSESVDGESLPELRRIVATLELLMGGPFLNKNNNNSTRIRELSRLFPRSLFIHVRRNPRDAIASLIRARKEHDVPPDGWWSVAPPQCYDTAPADTVKRSVLQICEVDDYIRSSFQEIPESRFSEVYYKSFCEHPGGIEGWVGKVYEDYGFELEKPGEESERVNYTASSSWESLSISTQERIEEMLSHRRS